MRISRRRVKEICRTWALEMAKFDQRNLFWLCGRRNMVCQSSVPCMHVWHPPVTHNHPRRVHFHLGWRVGPPFTPVHRNRYVHNASFAIAFSVSLSSNRGNNYSSTKTHVRGIFGANCCEFFHPTAVTFAFQISSTPLQPRLLLKLPPRRCEYWENKSALDSWNWLCHL